MAKYECSVRGSFDEFLGIVENEILRGNISASYEDGSDIYIGNVRCAVRVYERYSMLGKNRVSLSLTLLGDDNELFLSAITSGGSQAVFFKINTLGEGSFLNRLVKIVENYNRSSGR